MRKTDEQLDDDHYDASANSIGSYYVAIAALREKLLENRAKEGSVDTFPTIKENAA